ncbi:MAG: hypothetical protein HUK19_07610 [Fibrobacter sp.]|nr:hypothetical protein [Fibrobacter sp.]
MSSRAPTRDLPSLLIAAASFAGGWLLYRHHIRLPLGIERDLTCLGFFAMGYACKNLCRSTGFIKNLFIAIISFTLYAYFEKPNPWFSIMNNDLGKSALDFFASSLFGIVGLVFAFQLFAELPEIAPVKILKGILRNISRNALIILSVHWWALLILRIVFKPQLDKPYIAYCTIPIVAIVVIAAIPLFRCKFYKLIAKEKITAKESLSIR